MSSIFVDTIRKTGGTLGTDIRVKTTSVYESENSTGTTQNLVQGLAKAWAALNGSTFGLKDSFNITSATDNGTGDYTFTIANDMANANASLTANSGAVTTRSITDCAAGTYELDLYAADGSTRGDSARAFTALHGDLA
jgi:hypothetical protein